MRKTQKLILFSVAILLAGVSFLNFSWQPTNKPFTEDTYVYQALTDLGMPKPIYYPAEITEEQIQQGKDIVFHGHTEKPGGGKSKYVSLYYVCTNCHNTVAEDPDLAVMDPTARLSYAVEHNLPFLQGTTFFGIVNRETWYNDDYYKKYGDLVKPAKHDVREAIQLCAKECSKGRYLEEWEVQAILAYYYSISFKLSDIMSADEIASLNTKYVNNGDHEMLIDWIKSKYALKSPATFIDPPYNLGGDLPKGDPENGKHIFELSCQTCHKPYGCSDNVFDSSPFTMRKFANDFDKNYWWLFEAVRHGFYSYPGHEPYMPHYTAERMTDQQVMDLKAYFMHAAGKM
ncbi:MAG: cytochrome c [Chitinophagales bacterium]